MVIKHLSSEQKARNQSTDHWIIFKSRQFLLSYKAALIKYVSLIEGREGLAKCKGLQKVNAVS